MCSGRHFSMKGMRLKMSRPYVAGPQVGLNRSNKRRYETTGQSIFLTMHYTAEI
ncbi:hypothetical protein FIC_01246 [Flavobacteriaceae bacterium 3519-10]|nr:hypothetical protein FIC_01246 [Flavobacteriaceae bacterium 3519-10]